MKIKFKDINLRQDAIQLIRTCNDIIKDYTEQSLKLTLRQLYYQLVTKNVVPNTEKSYQRLSGLISNARLAGLMDWSAIEDRTRLPHTPSEFEDLGDLVNAAIRSYRLPRWEGQEHYAELWVEKDALAGVLSPLAREFHITLMVNRGYSSQTAMYEASKRFVARPEDTKPVLFYLGDHDPSGEDMVRDIRDRLEMFVGEPVEVQKLALTMAQVEKFNPPPNPAKLSDTRAAAYIEKYGDSSWEVDALPPQELSRIIRKAFKAIIDKDKLDVVLAKEEKDKQKLLNLVG
jgi:hypothetical protein